MVALADRCTVLRDGRVAAHRERGAFSVADLVQAMTGRAETGVAAEPLGRATSLLEDTGSVRTRSALRAGEVVGLAGLLGSGADRVLRRLFGLECRRQRRARQRRSRAACDARPTRSAPASAWCRASGGSA